jgi:hypothetical protein
MRAADDRMMRLTCVHDSLIRLFVTKVNLSLSTELARVSTDIKSTNQKRPSKWERASPPGLKSVRCLDASELKPPPLKFQVVQLER